MRPEHRDATLEDVLAEREARAAAQARLASRHQAPVLSLTLVTPGPEKDGPGLRAAMDRAEAALAEALAGSGFRVLETERRDGPAGPAFLAAVDASAADLKRLCVSLEDGLPWGRALDADVVTLAPGSALPEPLGRAAIGLSPRPCLLCVKPARECMALRRHGRAELAATAAAYIDSIPGNDRPH